MCDHRAGKHISVELFVRTLSPTGARAQQEAVIDRIQQLEAEAVINEFSLTVWGERICPESAAAKRTATGRTVLDRIEEFESWLGRTDIPSESAFETQDIDSAVIDEQYSVVVLPMLCLAVYEDDHLGCVAPWSNAETTHSVVDCLDAVADPTSFDGHPPEERTVDARSRMA